MGAQTTGFWLSPQQERLWKETAHPSGSLRSQCVIRLGGALQASQLRSALGKLTERHEILRTMFVPHPGMKVPFQVVLDSCEPAWTAVDFSSYKDDDHNAQVEGLRRSEWNAAADLAQGPVLHAALAKLTDTSYRLVLTLPGACADAQSLRFLVAELACFYGGTQPTVPEEPLRYAQFAQWQKELIESEEESSVRGAEFWKQQGELATPVIPLQGKKGDFSLAVQSVAVPSEIESKLRNLCGQWKIPVSDVVLSAWQVLSWRLAGQNTFITGVVYDGREYDELRQAIGLLAKTIPVETRIEGNLSLKDLAGHASQAVEKLMEWQEYFNPANHDDYAFAYEHISLPGKLEMGGLQWGVESVRAVWERFGLKLVGVEQDGRLRLEFQFDNTRFAAEDVARWAEHFRVLLTAAVTAPETPVAKLPWLSAAQQKQVLVDWNRTAGDFPALCFHQLFEQQAVRTPARTALVSNGVSLTYAELNAQANRLAYHLRWLGVGPDSRVGLCLERSTSLIVGLLAILKAGGAYVPLQSDHPKARLARQLEGSVALLTEEKLLDSMPAFPGHVLALDRDAHAWAKQTVANPDVNIKPSNLAYVIFTSGSTGVPKGVGIEHRNLLNYTAALGSQLKLESFSEGLRFATVSALNADLGNTCIFPALASGGALHVIPYETATDARRFADYFTQHAIDVLKIVPSHLQALLASGEGAQILPRKYLILGGETLTRPLLEKILALRAGTSSGCELINHYGPTETTVGSLTLHLKDYDWQHSRAASIPIGRPLANTQVYVLDAEMNPVPVGVAGELYIAGAGVARGYLGQPERTAERFLRDPFAADSAARMYRTGDLARWLPEGVIEFLGRADDQVKVRGFRIELGEVEASLLQHPNVQQAVVLARPDAANGTIPGENGNAGEKRLVAYVVPQTGFPLSVDDLRSHLKTLLPDYMVPSAVVLLEKLPLTSNGKVDRQKLPAPEMVAAAKPFVEPSTATEVALAAIWAEVLRKNKISADDNFFDLGGHSLLATQVISRIREQLQVEVALRAVFEQPTLTGLAKLTDEAKSAAPDPAQATITRVSREAYRVTQE